MCFKQMPAQSLPLTRMPSLSSGVPLSPLQALLVSSSTSPSWVKGGLEFNLAAEAPSVRSLPAGLTLPEASSGLGALGATYKATFLFGLQNVIVNQQFPFRFSGLNAQRSVQYRTVDYVQEINAAAMNGSSNENLFYGMQQIPYGTFAATAGLIGFSAFLSFAAWFTLALVQYDFLTSPKSLSAVSEGREGERGREARRTGDGRGGMQQLEGARQGRACWPAPLLSKRSDAFAASTRKHAPP